MGAGTCAGVVGLTEHKKKKPGGSMLFPLCAEGKHAGTSAAVSWTTLPSGCLSNRAPKEQAVTFVGFSARGNLNRRRRNKAPGGCDPDVVSSRSPCLKSVLGLQYSALRCSARLGCFNVTLHLRVLEDDLCFVRVLYTGGTCLQCSYMEVKAPRKFV